MLGILQNDSFFITCKIGLINVPFWLYTVRIFQITIFTSKYSYKNKEHANEQTHSMWSKQIETRCIFLLTYNSEVRQRCPVYKWSLKSSSRTRTPSVETVRSSVSNVSLLSPSTGERCNLGETCAAEEGATCVSFEWRGGSVGE